MHKYRMIAGIRQDSHDLSKILHIDRLTVLVCGHCDAVMPDSRVFEEVEGGHVEMR